MSIILVLQLMRNVQNSFYTSNPKPYLCARSVFETHLTDTQNMCEGSKTPCVQLYEKRPEINREVKPEYSPLTAL